MALPPLARSSQWEIDRLRRPPPAGCHPLAVAIGANIARIRSRADLSQVGLARRLGLDRSAVSRWEAGNRFPTLLHLHMVAAIDGRPASALLRDAERSVMPGQPTLPPPDEERHAAAD